ncbi:MAG: BrnT family toxin [Sphingomonadaceae bacterium]
MIIWDTAKRKRNLHEHGIDIAQLETVFDFPMQTREDSSTAYGEQRLQSLCWFESRVVFMVWKDMKHCARIISCRYASKYETQTYFKSIGY